MTITLRSMLLPLAGFALAAASIAYAGRHFAHARHEHEAAVASFNASRADAREVMRLRGMAQRINDRPRPEQDMIARLHDAMRQAGLDVPRHFQSLRLESDTDLPGAGPGAGLRRQSVAVSLDSLTVPQLGTLLLQWKRDQPLWDITRLELTLARGSETSADAGRYDASLTFSAVYAAPEPDHGQGADS